MTTELSASPDLNTTADRANVLKLTTGIVSAYVVRNALPTDGLPGLIRATHDTLATLGRTPADGTPIPGPVPAVPVRKSLFPDRIICLEDGKSFKSLKRHLRTAYGMTPEEYRAKWKLPADYPMVAPDYATHRANLARSIGLGRMVRVDRLQGEDSPADPSGQPIDGELPVTRLPERRRGRRPKLA